MHDLTAEPRSRLVRTVAPWWHTALLMVLLIGGSLLSGRQAHSNTLGAHHIHRSLIGIAAEWIFLLLTWWGLRMRRVPMSELLGFHRGFHALAEDVGAAAVFWVIAAIILVVIGLLLRLAHLSAPQQTLMAIAPRTPLELLLWLILSTSAGFCEEFAFRGYFLQQFASTGGGIWTGVVCSSLLFGISHGYEGAAGMIAIAAYGAMFCVLALTRKSLRPGMIAHAWHDIFSGVMLALLAHFHPM
jgi:membrane protease YdiL (CAAX protease family)